MILSIIYQDSYQLYIYITAQISFQIDHVHMIGFIYQRKFYLKNYIYIYTYKILGIIYLDY